MNAHQPRAIAALLVLAIGGLTSPPTAAVSDEKSISPMECLPRGPATVASELTYGPYGITNPGTTNESVICPITGDSDTSWSTTPGDSAALAVYYRIGSVPGNMTCTAFTGTAAVFDTSVYPTYSVSHTTATEPAGTRDYFVLSLADPRGYGVAAPTTLVCTLSPKAALGWIYIQETLATNSP